MEGNPDTAPADLVTFGLDNNEDRIKQAVKELVEKELSLSQITETLEKYNLPTDDPFSILLSEPALNVLEGVVRLKALYSANKAFDVLIDGLYDLNPQASRKAAKTLIDFAISFSKRQVVSNNDGNILEQLVIGDGK